MEYLPPCQMDELLDFSSDIGEPGNDEEDADQTKTLSLSLPFHSNHDAAVNSLSSSFPGFVEEEELEWISNKDAFPMVESFADFLPNQHPLAPALGIPATSAANHRSPVSVLENSSSTSLNSSGSHTSNNNNNITISCGSGGAISGLMLSISSTLKAPSRTRSNRRRKKRKDLSEWPCWTPQTHASITTQKNPPKQRAGGSKPSSTLGRKCQHCQTEKTPQWRAGPMGPKTLCNACGVRYKSGRLVPEYRPASSPTFSSQLHSNSHRKIVEMRKRSTQGTMMMESGLKPLGSP